MKIKTQKQKATLQNKAQKIANNLVYLFSVKIFGI
jgi:hypothetical protein